MDIDVRKILLSNWAKEIQKKEDEKLFKLIDTLVASDPTLFYAKLLRDIRSGEIKWYEIGELGQFSSEEEAIKYLELAII